MARPKSRITVPAALRAKSPKSRTMTAETSADRIADQREPSFRCGRMRFQNPSIHPRNATEMTAWLEEILHSGETCRPELPDHDRLLWLLQRGRLWRWDDNCTIQMCNLANSTGILFDRTLQRMVYEREDDDGSAMQIGGRDAHSERSQRVDAKSALSRVEGCCR